MKEIEKKYLLPTISVPKRASLYRQIVTLRGRMATAAEKFMTVAQEHGWMSLKAKLIVYTTFGFWPRENRHYKARRMTPGDKFGMRKVYYVLPPEYDGWEEKPFEWLCKRF